MGRTVEVLTGKAELCRSIMGALPDWFSEPGVIEASARAVEELPVFGYVEADVVTAMIALKPHLPDAVEIALIATRRAVVPDWGAMRTGPSAATSGGCHGALCRVRRVG